MFACIRGEIPQLTIQLVGMGQDYVAHGVASFVHLLDEVGLHELKDHVPLTQLLVPLGSFQLVPMATVTLLTGRKCAVGKSVSGTNSLLFGMLKTVRFVSHLAALQCFLSPPQVILCMEVDHSRGRVYTHAHIQTDTHTHTHTHTHTSTLALQILPRPSRDKDLSKETIQHILLSAPSVLFMHCLLLLQAHPEHPVDSSVQRIFWILQEITKMVNA